MLYCAMQCVFRRPAVLPFDMRDFVEVTLSLEKLSDLNAEFCRPPDREEPGRYARAIEEIREHIKAGTAVIMPILTCPEYLTTRETLGEYLKIFDGCHRLAALFFCDVNNVVVLVPPHAAALISETLG